MYLFLFCGETEGIEADRGEIFMKMKILRMGSSIDLKCKLREGGGDERHCEGWGKKFRTPCSFVRLSSLGGKFFQPL